MKSRMEEAFMADQFGAGYTGTSAKSKRSSRSCCNSGGTWPTTEQLTRMAQEIEEHLSAIRQILRQPVEAEFATGNLTGAATQRDASPVSLAAV